MNVLDRYILTAPDAQNALDLFQGEWSCQLPGVHVSLNAGTVPAFEDERVRWGLERLGGVQDQTVMELGPLEGGHSYMLEKSGAASVVAIESNAHAFLKCLVVKELLGLHRTRFLCGDFVGHLEKCGERFDVVFASGVLYHMRDPLHLLALIAKVTDRLFIWTHYFDREVLAARPDWKDRFSGTETGRHGSFSCAYHRSEYLGALDSGQFCGGSAPFSHWMEREPMLDFLRLLGFDRIDISYEQREHQNGPAFALVAQRSSALADAVRSGVSVSPVHSAENSQPAGPRPRSHYKEVWDALSGSEDEAKIAVAGYTDEDELSRTAEATLDMLQKSVGVFADDRILEIGSGVGRVGRVLAPLCREWTGADASENMLAHVRNRLSDLPNVRTVALNGYDLSPIADQSVDLVYSTVVFMHLDEWERFAYVKEGFRILKPGGRMWVDNMNLLSEGGWQIFEGVRQMHPRTRPSQSGKTSTPQELAAYFRRAGFENIEQREEGLWIITFARKPADSLMVEAPAPQDVAPASHPEVPADTDAVMLKATSTEMHLDFPVNLDAPEFLIQGWIISDQPIHAAKADGRPAVELKLVARADVEKAYPQHEFVTGFQGQGSLVHVKNGRLKLEFKVGDRQIRKFFRIAPSGIGGWIAQKDKDAKLDRIAPFLVCPVCHGRLQTRGTRSLRCRSCRTDFHRKKRHYDFLSARLRDEFDIVETATVSAHEYDPEVLELVSRFPDGLVLDCGAGFRQSHHPNVINFEIADYSSTDIRGVNERLPFADATFDAVLSLAVLEHVKNPFACAREIIRILKPGGIFHGVVPFLQPVHGYPHHYYNMTSQGLRNLFEPWLEIDRIEVPTSGRPIFTLTWFLNRWKQGLPQKPREEFLNLRVRDLLGDPSSYLGRSFVSQLPEEVNFELASTTLLQGRRKDSAPGSGAVPNLWKRALSKFAKMTAFRRREISPAMASPSRHVDPAIPAPPMSGDPVVRQAQTSALTIGRNFVDHFSKLGGLEPGHQVLDVGCADRSCGFGRMARALTEFLSADGSYHGFDLCQEGITWCRTHISSRFPGFHFNHADVFNAGYNPSGKISPSDFHFPHPDGSFDFVFLTSIFTHMLSPEVEHYLDEIARVLKPGGRCFITYFLLDEVSRRHMAGSTASFNFRHQVNPACQAQDERNLESAVAYDLSWIRRQYSQRGLKIIEPVTFGAWSGRPDATSDCQDFVIASK